MNQWAIDVRELPKIIYSISEKPFISSGGGKKKVFRPHFSFSSSRIIYGRGIPLSEV